MSSNHSTDLAKLAAFQILGGVLAFPTCGMSLAINLTAIDSYQQKYHPDFNYFINWFNYDFTLSFIGEVTIFPLLQETYKRPTRDLSLQTLPPYRVV